MKVYHELSWLWLTKKKNQALTLLETKRRHEVLIHMQTQEYDTLVMKTKLYRILE